MNQMDNLVDNLFKKPFQSILNRINTCKKRKRDESETRGPRMQTYFKYSAANSRKFNLLNLNNDLEASSYYTTSPLKSRTKKVKLSMSETYFLKDKTKVSIPKMADIDMTISRMRDSPFAGGVRKSVGKFRESNVQDLNTNDFKFTKAQNHEFLNIENFQNRVGFSEPGIVEELKMESPNKNIRPGGKTNPVIVIDDEEEKKEASADETINLLRTFDTATKNISAIPFDYLGSPILYEKEFEEKLSLTLGGIKEETAAYEEKKIEDTYQDEVGDMLFEKTMDQKRSFPLITHEQYNKIKSVWNHRGDQTANVVTHEHIPQVLSYKNLKTLSGLSWLNDEVINAYIGMLNKRDQEKLNKDIFIFNTFFYQSLESCLKSGNMEKIYRITKRAKINVSDCQRVFVPLNPNTNHWAFVHVDLQKKIIMYHDSFGYRKEAAQKMMSNIKQYIEQVVKQEKSGDQHMMNGQESYKLLTDDKYPHQDNCSDCGVFMLKGIDFMTQDLTPNFKPKDMPYFRLLITYELMLGRLLTPN